MGVEALILPNFYPIWHNSA